MYDGVSKAVFGLAGRVKRAFVVSAIWAWMYASVQIRRFTSEHTVRSRDYSFHI